MTQAQDPAAGGNPALQPEKEDDAELEAPIQVKLRQQAEQAAMSASDPACPPPEASGEDPEFSVKDAESRVRAHEAAAIKQADDNGGLRPIRPPPRPYQIRPQPRLPDPLVEPALFRPAAAAAAQDDAEAELVGMIAECRFLMREVAFHSARFTPDGDERMQFLTSACRLAETGARVGDTVARLRSSAQSIDESRKTLTYEVVHRTVPPALPPSQGEGGAP